MNVPRLLDEVRRQVPADAPVGTRFRLETQVALPGRVHRVAMAARIDARGRRREQFWCDGVRLEQAVLLRLTCAEGECPHAQQVRAQWAAFHGQGRAATRPGPPQPRPLMAEVKLTVAGQRFTARPARFPCFTPCPHGAHPPMAIEKTGFDLFDEVGCVGGGVVKSDGVRRPRFPTVRDAEVHLLARRVETLLVLGAARDAARGEAPPVAGDG